MKQIVLLFSLFIFFIAFDAKGQKTVFLEGKVVDEYNQPIESIHIFLQDYDERTLSKTNGSFQLIIPAEVPVLVRFQHLSYMDTVLTVQAMPDETVKINVALRVKGEMLKPIDIKAKFSDGYVRIDPNLNFRIPTPSGSVESILKSMPGISSSNELSSQYNVRGGNYDENLVYVNDIEIHRPFLVRNAQQEGLSFVNLDLTQSVKFSAGGFEAKYGDKMSSVMDVEYKRPTRYGASVSGSLLGATAHAEGNVKDVFTFLVGFRYKSNAYLVKSMDTKAEYTPRFFDTQILLSWRPVQKLEISLLGNFSNNTYLYAPKERETNYGSLNDFRRLKIYFEGQEVNRYENYLGGLTFRYTPNHFTSLKLVLSSYYAKESETYDILGQYYLKDLDADFGSNTVEEGATMGVGSFLNHARNYVTSIVSAADIRGEHRLKNNTISWSAKFQNEIIKDNMKEWALLDSLGYTLPYTPTMPGVPVDFDDISRLLTLGEGNLIAVKNALNTLRLSGFIQDTWRIDGDSATRFTLIAGLRYNFWSYNKEFLISPRISFVYKPRWKHDWVFYLKTGLYYQPPFFREMRNPAGELNPDIKAQRSFQVVGAAEYSFKMWRRPFKLSMEAYYKYMDRLVSYTVDNVKIVYSGQNDATGYATGLDVRLSGEFISGLESWISLSIMKTAEDLKYDYSEDGTEPGYIPRPTDQRFSINIFFQDHFPGVEPLRMHLNFVFASGVPYGPSNLQRHQHVYVNNAGKTRYLRTSWYRRVDVGFSYMFLEQTRDRMKHKSKVLRSIKSLGLFFEVFNLLGTNNVSSYMWVKDVNNQLNPVPNYLTKRLFNVKLAIEF